MSIESLKFFDDFAETKTTTNRLPHWEQDGRTYFVTFRTADSIPFGVASGFQGERDAWLAFHPKPWDEKAAREYWERFGSRSEKWLDESHGACPMREPEVAGVVAEALRFHDGDLCVLNAWVVMPNHVHVLLAVVEDESLAKLLHSWKSFTATKINRLKGESGALWQRDYFDRLVRDAEHFWRCARYIRQNPAKLRASEYLLWEAPWVSKGLDAMC